MELIELIKVLPELTTTIPGAIVAVVGLVLMVKTKKIKTIAENSEKLEKNIQQIDNKVNEIKNDVIDLKKGVSRNNNSIKRSEKVILELVTKKDITDSIEIIISHALAYCTDGKELMPFCEKVGRVLKSFTSDLLDIGFDNLTCKDIKAKFAASYAELDVWHDKFDDKFIQLITPKLKIKANRYLNDVISIKNDKVNNKKERLKNVTKVYLEEKMSFFINSYNTFKNKQT
jgi:hypothetical protein